MRKSLIIFLLIGGLVLGVGVFNSLVKSGEISEAPVHLSSPSPTTIQEFQTETSEVALPNSFSIPKLGVVNVMVESVGLDKESKMDIPRDENNVAWYNLGSRPGERGNTVIAGHYDKKSGAPAVFFEINKLKSGDELIVKDLDGKEHKYIVTEVKSYLLEEFPLIEVFGVGDKARLNLITCEGLYDKSSKLYSRRLVVYSELKS